jgi:shikimate dehydrogenase
MTLRTESFLRGVSNRASLDLDSTDHYAAILGAAPSKGARSPTLWNRAFKALNISAVMHPMDVAPADLAEIVEDLRGDPRFLGGAVAVPYKQEIARSLDELEDEAKAIGAVNCLYRSREGRLVGANTDGAAALMSIRRLVPDLSGAVVVLLGIGGAGRAVAAYLAKAIGTSGTLLLANRTPGKEEFARRLRAYCQSEILPTWPVPPEVLAKADLIVNATSIGSELTHARDTGVHVLLAYTPLAPIGAITLVAPGNDIVQRFADANFEAVGTNIEQSWRALQHVSKAAVFDIVYQPAQSILLTLARARGLKSAGGEMMNLEQAIISFQKAVTAGTLNRSDTGLVQRAMTHS